MKESVIASEAKQSPRSEEIASSSVTPRNDEGIGRFSSTNLLARAELLDHARHRRNHGVLPDADIVREEANPLCGDVVTIYASFRHPERSEGSQPSSGRDPSSSLETPQDDAVLVRVSFTGHGCLISQAAASLLTEHAVGKSTEDILRMDRGDIEQLIGGSLSPSRVKCAMLPLIALQSGMKSLRAQRSNPDEIASPARRSLGEVGSLRSSQ